MPDFSMGKYKADLRLLLQGAAYLMNSPIFIGALRFLMDTADPDVVKGVSQREFAGLRDKGRCRDLGNYTYTTYWHLLALVPGFETSLLHDLWVAICHRWPSCCLEFMTRRGMERAGDILEFVMGFVNHAAAGDNGCPYLGGCSVSDWRAYNDEFNRSLLALERLIPPRRILVPAELARQLRAACKLN